MYENARRWVQRGDKVTVVTSVYDKSDLRPTKLIERFDVDGIEVIVLNIRLSNKHGVLMRLYTFAAYAMLASWYALRHPSDVVVASSGPITVGLPALVARHIGRRPFVFEVRDLWPEGAIQLGFLRSKWSIRLARWFERRCYRAASAVVALSPGQADWVGTVSPSTRIITVPNASDTQLVESAGRLEDMPVWASEKSIILYAGTLGLIHGCKHILDAASEVQRRGRTDIMFVLIGDGNERDELEATAQSLGLTNVRFMGLQSKENVMRWLQEAVCTLFTVKDVPFLSTASPNKVFDSFAAGIPVIQTTQGWIRDLFEKENCGYNVPAADAPAMADAICHLVDDTNLRDEMGRNARRVAEEQFDRDLLAERMRRVLAEVAGHPVETEDTNEEQVCAA